jgi:hypothetical protein
MRTTQKMALGVTLLYGLVLCCVSLTRAESYNFFFNNVDQGPNSKSDAKVIVNSQPEKERTRPSETAAPAPTSSPVDAKPDPSASASTVELRPKSKHFQADITAFMTASSRSELSGRPGWLVSFGWYPIKYLGIRGYGGMTFGQGYMSRFNGDLLLGDGSTSRFVLGADLDVVPFHVSLFGVEDWLSLGAFVGASSLAFEPGEPITLGHVGARARVRLGEHFGAVAVAKFNVNYAAFETGLSWTF